MLDVKELKTQLDALQDPTLRQALQTLKEVDELQWANVPADLCASIVPSLRRHLCYDSKRQNYSRDAALVLGAMGDHAKPAVPDLIVLLDDTVSESVREAAVIALGKIGTNASKAVDRLVQLLPQSRPNLAIQVVRALTNIGRSNGRVQTALLDAWRVPVGPSSMGWQVANALCKLRITPPNLLEVLTKTLVDDHEMASRNAAAEALQWCRKKDKDVVAALLTASAGDVNENIRNTAKAGLTRIGLSHEEAIHWCSRELGDSVLAETALRKCGAAAIDVLIAALGDGKPAIRIKAARTLAHLGDAGATAGPALTMGLRDTDPEVRLAVAKSLWNVAKSEAAIPCLVELLRQKQAAKPSDDSEMRRRDLQTIMEALGRIGPPAGDATRTTLDLLAKDPNRNIRDCALKTLEKVNARTSP